MFVSLSLLIILLLSVSVGGIFSVWVGGVLGGFLLLVTYGLERWLNIPLRIGKLPLAILTPLVWGVTGGFFAMQWVQQHKVQTQTSQLQPLQRDLEATASLRSAQGKEVFNLRVEKDQVIYTLELRYAKGIQPKIPKITAHPTFHGPFIMPKPPKIRFFPPKNGVAIKRWELTLKPVLTGPLDTPRFVFKYRKKGKQHKVVVEPIAIEVSELGKAKQLLTTLKPGKPPVRLERPSNPRQVLWLSGLGASCILLLGLGFWMSRRGEQDEHILTPHEWVERELAALQRRKWLEQNEAKQHYFALSEIFRGYLERRFEFPALESTTEEIARWSKRDGHLDKDVSRDIRQLLQRMDTIKFAGHIPDEDEQTDIQKRIQSVLKRTVPVATEHDTSESEEPQGNVSA